MADKTGIEWTHVPGTKGGATWNPVTGCTKVSAGCDHCYAETLALRLQNMGQPKYVDGFAVRTHEGALREPFRWKEPRGVFVNSMSDLFHVQVPRDFLDRILAVMVLTPWHTYQVLTKRPQRAVRYLTDPDTMHRVWDRLTDVATDRPAIIEQLARYLGRDKPIPWPLPNLWLGTSVEDQGVTYRIDPLLRAPAALYFLSCEPLLGPLDIAPWLDRCCPSCGWPKSREFTSCAYCEGYPEVRRAVGWVIAGGESGRDHRPLDLDWARSLRDQWVAAGVPYFFKQIGGPTPKSGGRILDGREWGEFPEGRVETGL